MAPSSPPDPAPRRVSGRLRAIRARLHKLPGGAIAWRVLITLLGLVVILVGIVLLPLPGPGWLIIFAGLGVLATEYAWARHLLHRSRGAVGSWTRWSLRQNVWVRLAIGLAGVVVVGGAVTGSWYLYQVT